MKKYLGLMVLLMSSVSASAACPYELGVDENYVENVVNYVSQARGQCGTAIKRAAECSAGSSMDVQIAGAAQEVCEARFMSKLNQAEKAGYASLQARCGAKYSEMEGTMYRSMAAFCYAEIAKTHATMIYELSQPAE